MQTTATVITVHAEILVPERDAHAAVIAASKKERPTVSQPGVLLRQAQPPLCILLIKFFLRHSAFEVNHILRNRTAVFAALFVAVGFSFAQPPKLVN